MIKAMRAHRSRAKPHREVARLGTALARVTTVGFGLDGRRRERRRRDRARLCSSAERAAQRTSWYRADLLRRAASLVTQLCTGLHGFLARILVNSSASVVRCKCGKAESRINQLWGTR
ncbi:hypothetical protein EXIGLDRAFT_71298 [Exidia glandulosa HHB12029]|uniref:Uncharacterized protein n=1 Tax=Exidia glandulosa HHB12029 TaxID=1314781 RepID=A0A166MJM3_EXIGL|nr:hypothetical protein EXIGLDRAFT_71298 [Exidia glandulosa HHB12029]